MDIDLTPQGFVKYDSSGRVIERGHSSKMVVDLLIAQGKPVLEAPFANVSLDESAFRDDDYVDLSGAAPVLKPRPVITRAFDRTTLPVNEEATITGIDPCTVSFTGPVTGSEAHPGGDLSIEFSVPGDYTISFEPFPAMPLTFKLTVQP